jgi:hypothetical protein
MSLLDEHIKNELEKFAGRYGPATIVPAKVLSYNDDADTLLAELSSGAVVDDVRLKAMIKPGSKLLVVPKVGSMVLLGSIANSHEYVVVAVDEVEKLLLQQGSVTLTITAAGFTLAKGNDTLQQVLSDLIAEIGKIVVLMGTSPNLAALTAIDNRLKQILQ